MHLLLDPKDWGSNLGGDNNLFNVFPWQIASSTCIGFTICIDIERKRKGKISEMPVRKSVNANVIVGIVSLEQCSD